MHPNDLMNKALMSRRGKGIDVSIVLGHGAPEHGAMSSGVEHEEEMDKEKQDAKTSDLAPPPDHPLESDHYGGMMHGGLDGMKHSDLLDGMSEYDKEHLSHKEPKSLAERARKVAMSEKK